MSLNQSKVNEQVQFLSENDIDKIVGVWEGSFDAASATTRHETFFSSIQVEEVEHGFTRPVFTDLLWSTDGISYVDGGVGTAASSQDYAISFSDSSNIYIGTSKSTGTIYYKVIGYWIDSFDDTDPSVDSYIRDFTGKTINFDSRDNYQKIYVQGSESVAATTSGTIEHNLGYLPHARMFFESVSGEVWSPHFGGASNPFLYGAQVVELDFTITETQLEYDVYFGDPTTPRKLWYRVYVDGTYES